MTPTPRGALASDPATSSPEPWPDAGMEAAFQFLRASRRTETVMIDVGAHRGESLRLFSEKCAGPFMYVGLEPNPGAFEDLQRAATTASDAQRRTKCLQAAAGPKDGRATFNMTRASAVSGFLNAVDGLAERVPSGDHGIAERIEVSVVSIDTLLSQLDVATVDFFKVDAEGYDLEVLRGAERTLKAGKAGAVMTEVFFVPYREGQAFFWDIASWMSRVGYHFVNLYDTRNTSQGRLYTGNALWLSPALAGTNDFL